MSDTGHTPLGHVKPLEWWVADTGDTIADSIVGRYRLGKVTANANFRLETPSGLIEKPSPEYYWPKDEAKAAAQADYERRILSAIEPSPSLPILVEALERADIMLKQMSDVALHIGLEGTGDWDMVAGSTDMHGVHEAIRAALASIKVGSNV